ncbi:MAG: hypothetical protein II800_05950, partial [Lachnospiraceae bacterium]|nr:hypothetical protein [Lachnospiraceae bacterium]
WDLPPEYYTNEPIFYDKDHWYEAPLYQNNPEIAENAPLAYRGLDDLLASYGYVRHGNDAYYTVSEPITPGNAATGTADAGSSAPDQGTSAERLIIPAADRPNFNHDYHPTDEDETLLFFCHLGAELLLVGHLLGISPVPLWHGIYTAPTAVTVLNEERRYHDNAIFRIQVLGDTSHLANGKEPVSYSGAFGPVWQESDRS